MKALTEVCHLVAPCLGLATIGVSRTLFLKIYCFAFIFTFTIPTRIDNMQQSTSHGDLPKYFQHFSYIHHFEIHHHYTRETSRL